MLPRLLCEQLCSLNPDTPRLTFSVIWRLNELGDVIDEWFGRSVIRSVAKLSYAHAQSFIDEPDRCFGVDELPPIAHRFGVDDVKRSVLALHKVGLTNVCYFISNLHANSGYNHWSIARNNFMHNIVLIFYVRCSIALARDNLAKIIYAFQIAKNLRRERFDSGALTLNQVKLSFVLNRDTGLPCGYSVYEQRDSNRCSWLLNPSPSVAVPSGPQFSPYYRVLLVYTGFKQLHFVYI